MKKMIVITALAFLLATAIEMFGAETADIYLEKGKVALSNKKLGDSYDFLTKSISLDSSNFEAFYYRGLVFIYLNRFGEAVVDFTKSLQHNKDFPDAYNNRGLAYSYLDELDSAFDDFTKAIELDPRFSEAYMNRGSAYLSNESYEYAKKDFAMAEKLNPKNPELHFQKGRLNYIREEFDLSIKEFTKAIELGLKSPKIYYNRANAYVKNNQFDKAVDDYSIVLISEPEDLESLNNRAYSYDKLGKSDLAAKDKKVFEELRLKLYPPIEVKNYIRIKDPSGTVSMEVPENWMTQFTGDNLKIDLLISKDSLNPKTDALVYGAIAGFVKEMPKELTDSSDAALLEFWNEQQLMHSQNFELYHYKQKKNMKYRGWTGYQNILKVQYAKGYLTFIMTEFVIAYQGKLFYCYFQAPENEYDMYKEIFDRMEKSVEINLIPEEKK